MQSKMTLQLANLSDFEEVCSLEKSFHEYISPKNGNKAPFNPEQVKLTLEGRCDEAGVLPPGGNRENYALYKIVLQEKIVGFLSAYYGYPDEETLFIAAIYISESYQKKGLATEAIQDIQQKALKRKIKKIRLVWDLKNWEALFFWFSCGFKTIVKLEGDRSLSEDTFCKSVLEKSL